ncbi:transposase [Amycolatopsis magusensis]|uniref:transposase n=1 Tax=Amycolatopsis magusensis TaxID=882444 RepID=UPI0034D4165B
MDWHRTELNVNQILGTYTQCFDRIGSPGVSFVRVVRIAGSMVIPARCATGGDDAVGFGGWQPGAGNRAVGGGRRGHVRDVIHAFTEIGLTCLDPRWAGGRPRLLSPEEEEFVVATAVTRPAKLGRPFTRWSIRKLADYLPTIAGRMIRIGREALRCLPARHAVAFQRTKTWKESADPERTPSSSVSRRRWRGSRIARSPSTSSGRSGFVPPRPLARPGAAGPIEWPRPNTARTVSPIFTTAATRLAMTPCGVSTGGTRAR